jgi:hypothetical protein
MSENTISSEIYNVICEAYGCYAKATTEISVKVGQQGTISLLLCKECVNRFTEKRGPDA